MNRILRGSFIRLKYFRKFLSNGEFDIEEWKNSNFRDLATVQSKVNEYQWSIGKNLDFISRIDGCLIHWQQVINVYIENPVNYFEKNFHFIDGQIAHHKEIIEICESEEQRLEQLMIIERAAQ